MSLSLQKQHHINQLLTTAAGGTGVVGDLDALHAPHHMLAAVKGEPKAERNLWREDEMLQMLHLMLKANAIELLNDKTVKSEKVFRNIEKLMFESGYTKKTFNQIWTKWKFLKSTYMTSKRAGIIPKMIPPAIYTVLETILNSASNVSICSNSNGAGGSSFDGDASDSGRMVIANAELSGLSNGVGKSGKKQSNGGSMHVEDDAFGMAHPIFGFRLGMVKSEPEDTGYEIPNANVANSEHDPIDEPNDNSHCSSPVNADFPALVKAEVVEAERSNSPPPAEESPQLEVSPTLTESATTSTPKANIPPQMPPLRIAPFAKASQMNMQRQQMNRSPPPLSMHPLHQQKRQQEAMQQVHHHFTRRSQGYTAPNMQRQLLPKPDPRPQQQHRMLSTSASGTQIRLPREITLHQTRPVSMARTKHVPMRPINNKAYKGQKIETVVPDMGSSIMLQQKQHVYPTYVPSEHASTSHQAATGALATFLSSPDRKQKRRMQLPPMDQRPTKLMRTQGNIHATNTYEENNFYREQRNDDLDAGDEANQPPMMEPIKQFQQKPFMQQQKLNMQQQKKFQQQQKQFQQQQKEFQQKQKKAQKKQDEENFEAALKDLGKSMRLVQREILDDFFEKQMDLAREEHEFQAQQDKLLMQAFEEQTQLIMESAKTLLGIELPGLKKSSDAKLEAEAAPAAAEEVQEKEEAQKIEDNVENKEEHGEEEEEEEEEDEEACMEQEDDEDDEAEGEDEDESESEDDEQDEENMEQDAMAQHAGYFNEEHENENVDEEQDDEDSYEDEDQMENHTTDPSELVSSELVED